MPVLGMANYSVIYMISKKSFSAHTAQQCLKKIVESRVHELRLFMGPNCVCALVRRRNPIVMPILVSGQLL